MIAKELISSKITALNGNDTGQIALNRMKKHQIFHLPVVCKQKLKALISDKDIYKLNFIEEQFSNYSLPLIDAYITENQHIYEVLNLFLEKKVSLIPVLNSEKKYVGAISIYDLLRKFSDVVASKQPGAVIVLKTGVNNYSLTEIANIVESNNTRVLSVHVGTPNNNEIEITLKLNSSEISGIIQTFERYDYHISAYYSGSMVWEELLKNRVESLQYFMDI